MHAHAWEAELVPRVPAACSIKGLCAYIQTGTLKSQDQYCLRRCLYDLQAVDAVVVIVDALRNPLLQVEAPVHKFHTGLMELVSMSVKNLE